MNNIKLNKDMSMNRIREFGLVEDFNKVSDFVAQATKDRDLSHGYNHMYKVAMVSLEIFSELYPNNKHKERARKILLSAFLHDVADHKYDEDGNLKKLVDGFLGTVYPKDKELVCSIIDWISFSREVKTRLKGIDFNKLLLDELKEEGYEIRNIVSDADKLEALGKNGFERCVIYTKESYKEKNGRTIPNNLLVQNVVQHSKDKLLRLKDEFIMTEPGRRRAEPLHLEFVEELSKMMGK